MNHWKNRQPNETQHCPRAMCHAMAADGGYFYCEYAYSWAYFFVSPHAERREQA